MIGVPSTRHAESNGISYVVLRTILSENTGVKHLRFYFIEVEIIYVVSFGSLSLKNLQNKLATSNFKRFFPSVPVHRVDFDTWF